ncbi:MAG: ABC-F family ATP-binding cassette domain-containing protein [Defluviitaleaceae bacterium]|nr:ABC-F family ATP-binding cassette domain-containing protein [Defluviitaleaceae bacterium]
MIFSSKDISLSFGATQILKNISFNLASKQKAGLVGVNGAGKTSLFKIILGEQPADSGEISIAKGAKIGHLAQNMDLNLQHTISEELLSVFAHLEQLEEDIRTLEQAMASQEGVTLEKSMSKYAKMTHEFENAGGYEYKSRVRGVASGLGFLPNEHELPIAQLSGGQKTRVGLGKLLLSKPDLLLLDEPTNHLDIGAIGWLEDYFLREYDGCVLIISHDRYFLDKVVKKVIEIERGVAKSYNGNYSAFVEQKTKDLEIAEKHYANQQRDIKKQEESIALLKSFNREKSLKRARSKEKQLAKVERLDAPQAAPSPMRLALSPKTSSGNDVLRIKNAEKIFGNRKLFRNVDVAINKGEKVALIGENGIGKTTLFKMIIEGDNAVMLGSNVKIGYYDQTLKFDDLEKTVFMEVSDNFPRMKNVEIRNALAAFLFIGDDVFKPISALSGGERGRVALAKLMLSDVNFLLLDEPTNHLDLFSKEILEGVVNTYEGTVLYISHDRYFINNTADKIYELTPNCAISYLGNYDYYTEKQMENNTSSIAGSTNGHPQDIPETSNKQSYLEQKEQQAKIRQTKARIQKLEKMIEETEISIAAQDEILSREDIATNAEAAAKEYAAKTELEERLHHLLEEWEEISLCDI